MDKNRRFVIGDHRPGSGKFIHPSRHWYISLAVEFVEKLNNLVNYDNLKYSRKAMIRCGLTVILLAH